MIAKGLDFPNVTLVGVVAADSTLNLPDYRAQERTFQLVTQVAGRAGRAGESGEVVVQTYQPEHPCIIAAAAQDYRAFFTQEFDRRRAGLYPPFTMIARLLVGKRRRSLRARDERPPAGTRWRAPSHSLGAAHPAQKRRVLMLRGDVAPVARIRGKYRYHVLLKLFEHPDAQPVIALMAMLALVSDPHCQIFRRSTPRRCYDRATQGVKRMATRKIVEIGDEKLRKHCKTVEKFDLRLKILLRDMADTMYKNDGGRARGATGGASSNAFAWWTWATSSTN